MNIIYFLIPLALILGALFVTGFIWATKKGQYDDLETPAHRMLLEDEKVDDSEDSKKADAEGDGDTIGH